MLRKIVLSLALAGTVGAVAMPAVAATKKKTTTKSVKVGDNYFVRSKGVPTVTVKRGTKVTWRFAGDSPHNVSVTKGPAKFKSSTKTSGTYSKRVTKKGTYTIICTIHGASDQQMKLRVR